MNITFFPIQLNISIVSTVILAHYVLPSPVPVTRLTQAFRVPYFLSDLFNCANHTVGNINLWEMTHTICLIEVHARILRFGDSFKTDRQTDRTFSFDWTGVEFISFPSDQGGHNLYQRPRKSEVKGCVGKVWGLRGRGYLRQRYEKLDLKFCAQLHFFLVFLSSLSDWGLSCREDWEGGDNICRSGR